MSDLDLDKDGRAIDEVFQLGYGVTLGAAGAGLGLLGAGPAGPLAAGAIAPYASKAGNAHGDALGAYIDKHGAGAETGAWLGGLGGLLGGGPLAGMVGASWGSMLGKGASDLFHDLF